MPKRAAIYARFSSDRQRETSITDQTRVCRARADALGLSIVATFADENISGSVPVANRPGGRSLLAGAVAGDFDALIIEGLDRLSRDSVDNERVVRRLEHVGIRVVGASDGYDSESGSARKILRAVKGAMNEAALDELRYRVHRGLEGQLERGFHAGGLSYGYRSVVAGVDDRGESIGYLLEIEAERAEVVRWIFTRYAEGWSCQRIAADLNARGVRGPGRHRGKSSTWSVSALYGSPNKGSGILNNDLYRGLQVWNRSRWVKDPDSGKRERYMRPESEWVTLDRPELRIVDHMLWSAVRRRMETPRRTGGNKGRSAPPRTIFGGLLRCGCCGGAMIAVSASTYGCAARKDRGPAVCEGVRASRARTDVRLLAYLRSELLAPEAIAEIERRVRDIIADARREAVHQQSGRDGRAVALQAEIGRLVHAIGEVGISPALAARLRAAEAELAALPDAAPVHAIAMPDGSAIVRKLREVSLRLGEALERDTASARLALGEWLPAIPVENRDGGVYALMPNGPEMLVALGAVADSKNGCGGRIHFLESRSNLVRLDGPDQDRRAA